MPVETLSGRRPPQTPENSITTANNQFFENMLQLRALYRLRQRYTNLPPQDRFTSSQESQEPVFPSSGSMSFKSDFEQIHNLHTKLGMRQGQRLSHDPAMERARYERATSDEGRQAVKQGVIIDMEKTLYERAFTSQSTVMYYQDNAGRIYHPDFPGESFDIVLQRGLEYSKSEKFTDYQRELQEFEGWKEVMTVLFDPETPLESKAISVSGRGQKAGTAFTDNSVDIFTKTLDPATNRVVVVMTRFASDTSYEEYKKIAVCLDSNYFGAEEIEANEELEIYFKRHPIFIGSTVDSRDAQQIFNQEFKRQKRATEEEKTKHYLDECKLFILHYAETICAKFFEPESVKTAFNAVVNKFDSLRKSLVETFSHTVKGISEFGRKVAGFSKTVQEDINHYGRMKVEEMMVGCGLSGGFSIGSSSGGILESMGKPIASIISAVGGFFGFSRDKDYCIRCGACGKEIKCVVRKGERCPRPSCKAVRQC